MKLAASQLTYHLTKQLAPLYIVSGDDPFLVEEALEQIRASAIQQEFSEHIRMTIEPGSTDWNKIFYTESHNFSLFAKKRLLELNLTETKLNATHSKILQEYAEKPSHDIVLLVRTPRLDNQTEKSHWYKALDKVSVIIPIWPLSIEQLPNWLNQRAKKFNLTITKSAAELLATFVEGNVLAANQSLEKLSLLNLPQPIDQEMIANIVTDHAHFDIFALVDSSLAGNIKRCNHILKNLAANGIEPTLILWGLTRELRTMADIAQQLTEGMSLATLFMQFRIFEKRQPFVRTFLKTHQKEDCWELLLIAADIDKIIKGAEPGNAWDALSTLTSCMAEKEHMPRHICML